jgi:hypothetical protein
MPAYVSETGYQSWSCKQLSGEQQRLSQAYAVAARQQENAQQRYRRYHSDWTACFIDVRRQSRATAFSTGKRASELGA